MTDAEKAAAPAAADETAVSADTSADMANLDTAPVQEDDEDTVWASIQAEKKGLEEPVDTKDPGEAEAAEKADKAETQSEPADIWASATPEQKAAFEAAISERAKFEERFRSSAARAGSLQRKINAARKEASRAEPARDELAGISQDYPEIAQPLEKALARIDGRLENLTKARQSEIESDEAELAAIIETETKTLAAKHPDYVTVLKENGPAFAAWVEDQPARVRAAAYRNGQMIVNADEAAQVIEGFKKFINPEAAKAPDPQPSLDSRRQRQMASLSSPQRSGSSRPTVSGIPEEGDEEAIWAAIQAEKRRKNA